ncbi:MAG: ribosomal protein S18-alanine N-acetyltransferase [Methanosarcinales archaeon]
MILIRKFQVNDFEDVISIEQEAFKECNPQLYMDLYELSPDGFLVAELNGKVVGFVIGLQISCYEGRIFSIAVNKKYRGIGIGTQLMLRILNVFRANNISEVTLEVRVSNIRAQYLYRRLGFQACWIEKGYYDNGEDAIIMKKSLSPLKIIKFRNLRSIKSFRF